MEMADCRQEANGIVLSGTSGHRQEQNLLSEIACSAEKLQSFPASDLHVEDVHGQSGAFPRKATEHSGDR